MFTWQISLSPSVVSQQGTGLLISLSVQGSRMEIYYTWVDVSD
ncbi:hypothetical protein ACLMCB_18795 [Paenibacillus sp. S29]